VHVIVPEGVDDPARPSGGNAYDRRIVAELVAAGWDLRPRAAAGSWPWPDAAARDRLARIVSAVPNGDVLLVDGLIASTVPEILVPAASLLSLVVLVHLPLGDEPPGHDIVGADARERAVLWAASAVITTSSWTRERLVDRYRLGRSRVHVAEPGVDLADPAPGTPAGQELLCVGAVTPHKGHDLLLAALAIVGDLPWRCVCIGRLDRDPPFVDLLRRRIATDGLDDRVVFRGPYGSEQLARAYADADVLVLPSRAETYGMVVTEALARGLPVIASDVGGVPEALGQTADGRRPGRLIAPDDPRALSAALRGWLGDGGLRLRLRQAAAERRATLPDWTDTMRAIAPVLAAFARVPSTSGLPAPGGVRT
jgi:glycosyltransferase involved in cell wall biosynthesis